jgi:hypothetical protein
VQPGGRNGDGVRVAVLVGAAVAAVSCSGPGTPTAAGYTSQVAAICSRLTADLQSVGPLPRGLRDPSQERAQDLPAVAAFLDRNVAVLRAASGRLRDVTPPEGEQALARQWLADLDSVVGDLAGAADAAHRGDVQTFVTAAFESAPQDAADRDSVAQRLGIGGCPGP